MKTSKVCICPETWSRIRRKEIELDRLRPHKKIYKKAIQQIEEELKPLYKLVRKCRQQNHPDKAHLTPKQREKNEVVTPTQTDEKTKVRTRDDLLGRC